MVTINEFFSISIHKVSFRTFESDIIIHDSLERTYSFRLSEKKYISPFYKQSSRYIYIEQPVYPMNSMSGNCVVMTNYPSCKHWRYL